jgi:hypothetical protein
MAKTTLLIGDPGSGKTTAGCTDKHPLFLIDVDCKADRMENIKPLIESGAVVVHPVRIPLMTDSFRDRVLNPDKGVIKQPEGYLYVVDLLNRILANDPEFDMYASIMLDSLTRLLEHLKRLLIHLRGKGKFGKKVDGDMNWPSWGSYLSNLEELFTQLIQMDKNFICTAHQRIETEHDDLQDISIPLGYWPMVDGQMMKKLSGYFDECYFMERKVKKNNPTEYFFRTVGSKYCARTSLKLPEFVPANISNLMDIHRKNMMGGTNEQRKEK